MFIRSSFHVQELFQMNNSTSIRQDADFFEYSKPVATTEDVEFFAGSRSVMNHLFSEFLADFVEISSPPGALLSCGVDTRGGL